MKTAVLFIFCFIIAIVYSQPIDQQQAEKEKPEEIQIYVVSHGWHTGLILPGRQIRQKLPGLFKRFSDAAYIEFGWGDQKFYQADDPGTGLALRAILWPTKSVVHAAALPDSVSSYFYASEVIELTIGQSEFDSLMQFISNTFYKNKQGRIEELGRGLYGSSWFYKGRRDYFLTNTCNKWTAEGLKSAGFDITPFFKITAGSIMDYLKKHKQKQLK